MTYDADKCEVTTGNQLSVAAASAETSVSAAAPPAVQPSPEAAPTPSPQAAGKPARPEAARRGGAPAANLNNFQHGLRSERLSGSRLPQGYKSEEIHCQKLGRLVRSAYQQRHGRDLDAYAQTLLLRILRAERSARWAARHLRKRGDDLSLADQKMLLDTENAAGDTIDKAMRAMGLDGNPHAAESADPFTALDRERQQARLRPAEAAPFDRSDPQ